MQKSEMIEVRCFDVPDEDIRNLTEDRVEIRNPKSKRWQEHQIVHSFEECPVCGKYMHVLAVKGTSWLAFCSKECGEKFAKMEPRVGGLYETLRYFRKERGVQ
jgi:hypothetical protein